MPRKLSASDLAKMLDGGATVETADKEMVLVGFSDLLELMRSREESAAARFKSLEKTIAASIEKIAISNQNDVTPILEALPGMIAAAMPEHKERGAFDFTVRRDGNGFIESMTATPKQDI